MRNIHDNTQNSKKRGQERRDAFSLLACFLCSDRGLLPPSVQATGGCGRSSCSASDVFPFCIALPHISRPAPSCSASVPSVFVAPFGFSVTTILLAFTLRMCISVLLSGKMSRPVSPCFAPRCQFYAPSLPNSSVHSEFLFRSSCDTVGLDDLTDLTKSLKSTMGSRSSSVVTASQVISIASGSPGEQGVTFRAPSTIT